MPFYCTKTGPPQFPSGIAAAIRQAKNAPRINISLAMRVETTDLGSDDAIETREWMNMKPTYFEWKLVDREDIAEIESVLSSPSNLAARLLVRAILRGLKRQYEELGGEPSLKHAHA